MINEWKTKLSAIGFEKIGRRTFRRSSVPVAACIYETPLRVGRKEVRINTAIQVQDPWISDQTHRGIDLRGDVAPDGICVYFDESPYWLHPEEANSALAVLEDCAEGWFDYWSNPRHLIQYLENPKDIILTRRSPTTGLCEHLIGVPVKKRSAPHADCLLSLLHYHIGNFQEALDAAKRFLKFVDPLTAFEGEPGRTKRQIKELSSRISCERHER